MTTKTIRLNTVAIVLLLFSFASLKAQDANPIKEKIVNAINGYFALDRESFHLQFDKTIFLDDEEIWFKGYVFNRGTNLPFYNTTNVFATLYDQQGSKISEQLLYANTGTFSGSFKPEALPSGNYYIRVSTNWMNNFIEDESASYKIMIVNGNDSQFKKPDYSKIKVEFHPEGGTFLRGVNNIMGVSLSGCNGEAIPLCTGEVINTKGEVVQKIFTNKFGYGRFEIIPTNENYKVVFTVKDDKIEAFLPTAVENGIALEVNNYFYQDKFLVKLKTNAATLKTFTKNSLYIVVQQDDKLSIVDVIFKNGNPEQMYTLPYSYLFDGVNTVRLIDSNLKELANRQIIKFPDSKLESDIQMVSKTPNSVSFSGKLNFGNANLSISVLPENSLTADGRDIFAAFLLNPYLTDAVADARYYFDKPSKTKKYELDLLLLNQKSPKYNWDDILMKPPKTDHEFDLGLTIKGTVNQSLGKSREKYKIKLFSLFSRIIEFSEIDENNGFLFKNIVLVDSSEVSISLVKLPDFETVPLKYASQVTNGRSKYNRIFIPSASVCEVPIPENEQTEDYMLPEFRKNIIYLDQVAVKVKDPRALTRSNRLQNLNLRGYKTKPGDNMSVATYIGNNGFDVSKGIGDLMIYARGVSSINGSQATPMIYLDDIRVMSFDQIDGMTMDEVDEIYMNPQAIIPSLYNNRGIIRIYRKTPSFSQRTSTSLAFKINDGFSRIKTFINANYASTSDIGFRNFGVLDWIPYIITEENGDFKFNANCRNQKAIQLLIEGFSIDGKLISEIKTFTLE